MTPESATIVIFGATGDLARRKLVPALFNLRCKSRLPERLNIVGFSRSQLSDDQFRELMWEGVHEFGGTSVDRGAWENFAGGLSYLSGNVDSLESFNLLKQHLEDIEEDYQLHNRLFYLSTAPTLFEDAIKNLGASGLASEEHGWSRVVLEKPFGRDLASAQALNRAVHQVFDERQVLRIDHYLGKETVQNIMVFRFANVIFEPLWNRNYIDSVQITVAEEVSVGDRSGYYDQSGVLRDMVQNHLLQLLTMVAMEPPNISDAESLRDKKVEVLRGIRRWTPEEAIIHAVRGQYRGYLQEKGVPPDSITATYAALRLYVDNWRWSGVPFYLRTGKAMSEKVSEIIIKFKIPPHLKYTLGPCQDLSPNMLALRLQPDEGAHLTFQAKIPDDDICMQSVDMDFNYQESFANLAIPEAYERLLQDALEGDTKLFIRNDHIEEAWRIADPLIRAWEDTAIEPVHLYQPGSWGPEAADALLAQDGETWLRG